MGLIERIGYWVLPKSPLEEEYSTVEAEAVKVLIELHDLAARWASHIYSLGRWDEIEGAMLILEGQLRDRGVDLRGVVPWVVKRRELGLPLPYTTRLRARQEG